MRLLLNLLHPCELQLNNSMEGEFKEKFVEYVNNKTGKLSNSFTITNSKRDRVIQCLKNPQLEPSSKFRFWVRQKKFRLLQSEDNEEDIVGIPTDLTIEDDVMHVYLCSVFCLVSWYLNISSISNTYICKTNSDRHIRLEYSQMVFLLFNIQKLFMRKYAFSTAP